MTTCTGGNYKKADIGDAHVEYLEHPGEGPTIVMLHATGFLPCVWHPIAKDLAADHRVIAPFFCRHREPNMETGGLGWRLLAKDLVSLFQALDVREPYYLVGHSMGGTLATLATAQLGLKPEAMVLIEPIFLPEMAYTMEITVDQHPLASKSIKRRNHWKDRQEAREYLLANKFFASWNPDVLEIYLEHGMVDDGSGGLTLTCQPKREAALFLGSNEQNPWPLLEKVKCPVLVVEGETTENKAFIDYPSVTEKFPKGSYELVKNTGHLVVMERPNRTLNIIRDFFNRPKAE